jgi:branched-chain amino acid transport system ATP-binding protein
MRETLAKLRARDRQGAEEVSATAPLLALEGVTAKYGTTTAIRDVDITLGPDEVVAILGANGAGKTTTLNAIVGLVAVSSGRITHRGGDITRLSPERIVERRLSLTPEGRQVFGSLTCLENLRVGAGINGQSQFADRRDQVLELFPVLRDKLDVFAGLLSGGEQQQLAIARSLMSDPEVLLLDEPSLGLAPLIVERVFELIVTLRDRGMSLMIAEQNVDKALQIADRAYVLSTGRVELEGTASKLLERTEIEEAYLGLGVREEDA